MDGDSAAHRYKSKNENTVPTQLHIVADENIAFAEKAFSRFGRVTLVPGRKICNEILQDADVLLVRSVTKVDEQLLTNTPVKFAGTATIGRDHIDENYLQQAGIAFSDAAGCNANAVAEYVLTALISLVSGNGHPLAGRTMGIIGVGRIGSLVKKNAEKLGMHVLCCDPPLQARTGQDFASLETVLTADFVSVHTPLTLDGQHKTHHLINADTLARMNPNAVFINSARGAVVDNAALLNWKGTAPGAQLVLDVWENEPDISPDLLAACSLATPHIAGYSLEGKLNGTALLYKSLATFLDQPEEWVQPEIPAGNNIIEVRGDLEPEAVLFEAIRKCYAISTDDRSLRRMLKMDVDWQASHFDQLRKNYPLRRECAHFIIALKPMNIDLAFWLQGFGFSILS